MYSRIEVDTPLLTTYSCIFSPTELVSAIIFLSKPCSLIIFFMLGCPGQPNVVAIYTHSYHIVVLFHISHLPLPCQSMRQLNH